MEGVVIKKNSFLCIHLINKYGPSVRICSWQGVKVPAASGKRVGADRKRQAQHKRWESLSPRTLPAHSLDPQNVCAMSG